MLLYQDKAQNRFNDGKCDRLGRFSVGTMNNTPGDPDGSFYRIDPDLSVHVQFGDVYRPNCVAFGPNDRVLYYGDTKEKKIWVFDFDLAAGTIGNRRLFRDCANHPGNPTARPSMLRAFCGMPSTGVVALSAMRPMAASTAS